MNMMNAAKIRLYARPALLSFLLPFCIQAPASELVGKLQFVAGEVKAIAADGSTRLLKKGDSIYTGETIKSGDGGTAQVIMQDQNRLVVRTDTELKVKEFKFDSKKPEQAKSVILLQQGAIRSFSGPNDKGKTGQHLIETPLATVGVSSGDREIIHIKQPATANSSKKVLPTGTFSKVYSGEAIVESPQGKLKIGKHQVGRVASIPGIVKKPEKIAELPEQVEKKITASVGVFNLMDLSNKGSTAYAGPDVSLTPASPAPLPIPYPNVGMTADTSKGSKKIKINTKEVALKNSNFKKSMGDEPGINKGVVSSKMKGKSEFINFSFDVKIEGKNVPRAVEMTTQNKMTNAPAGVQIAPSQTKIKVSP